MLEPVEAHLPPIVLSVELGGESADVDTADVVLSIRERMRSETPPDRSEDSERSDPGEDDDDGTCDRVHAGVPWHPPRVQSTPRGVRWS